MKVNGCHDLWLRLQHPTWRSCITYPCIYHLQFLDVKDFGTENCKVHSWILSWCHLGREMIFLSFIVWLRPWLVTFGLKSIETSPWSPTSTCAPPLWHHTAALRQHTWRLEPQLAPAHRQVHKVYLNSYLTPFYSVMLPQKKSRSRQRRASP